MKCLVHILHIYCRWEKPSACHVRMLGLTGTRQGNLLRLSQKDLIIR